MTERIPRFAPAEMTDEQREIYDRFTASRGARPDSAFSLVHPDGGLTGPANAWLLSPPVGRALERLGAAVRFKLELGDRAREIAILTVAYFRDSTFEAYAHVAAGRSAGLTEDELGALAAGHDPELVAADEIAVRATTKVLLERGTLDATEYAEARDVLGERGLFELVILVGYYQLLATQLAVFDVRPPEQAP